MRPESAKFLRRAIPWLCAIALVVSVLFCIGVSARLAISRGNCVKDESNLKWIGYSIREYAQWHDGKFPDSFETLLLNSDLQANALVSNLTKDTAAQGPTTQAVVDQLNEGGHCSYTYLGRGFSISKTPQNAVIAFEPISVGSRKIMLLFCDGIVETYDSTVAKRVFDQVSAGNSPILILHSTSPTP